MKDTFSQTFGRSYAFASFSETGAIEHEEKMRKSIKSEIRDLLNDPRKKIDLNTLKQDEEKIEWEGNLKKISITIHWQEKESSKFDTIIPFRLSLGYALQRKSIL